MDAESLPILSLRREVVICLAGYADSKNADRIPVLSPRGVLAMLNDVGPDLSQQWLPLIEATLDSMFAEGLVGRIPAPSVDVPPGYCCRRFAERAIGEGLPVILLPRKGGRYRGRRVALATDEHDREGETPWASGSRPSRTETETTEMDTPGSSLVRTTISQPRPR